MLIEENTVADAAVVTAYESGRIEIGATVYTEAVVLRDGKVFPAVLTAPSELTSADFLQTASAAGLPEVIIVGTGATQQFLHPQIAAELAAQGVGLECMNTASACRTLLLLQGEGRKVWAWLWP